MDIEKVKLGVWTSNLALCMSFQLEENEHYMNEVYSGMLRFVINFFTCIEWDLFYRVI